jgi:hypothetical protein
MLVAAIQKELALRAKRCTMYGWTLGWLEQCITEYVPGAAYFKISRLIFSGKIITNAFNVGLFNPEEIEQRG